MKRRGSGRKHGGRRGEDVKEKRQPVSLRGKTLSDAKNHLKADSMGGQKVNETHMVLAVY